MERLREQIERAINCCNAEGPSNTPDFILSEFLTDCLAAYDKAQQMRAKWYGHMDSIGGPIPTDPLKPAPRAEAPPKAPGFTTEDAWHAMTGE